MRVLVVPEDGNSVYCMPTESVILRYDNEISVYIPVYGWYRIPNSDMINGQFFELVESLDMASRNPTQYATCLLIDFVNSARCGDKI